MEFRSREICNSVRIVKLVWCFVLLFLSLFVQPFSLHGQSAPKTSRKVMVRVQPDYPDFFKNGHFQGRVVAEATVLPNGNVSSIEVKSGNPMFAEFASKALMKWKYAPGPEKTVEEVTFNFSSTPD
jgi:TonB family protein